MAWSKSTRIGVMLAIDIAFFLLELIAGFLVHSLALMADAFHMLNDIISLLVGLWAVQVAQKATTDKFSYGWLRAEILGAFFNAVFLIALCVSIVLEAVTRFFDPPEIQNPKLILIVGSLGLASNLVGFLVLGGHGHSHGPEGHSHGEGGHSHAGHGHSHDPLDEAEEGRADGPSGDAADESGRVADLLPEAAVARYTLTSPERSRHIRFDAEEGPRSDPTDRGSRTSAQSRGRDRRRSSVRHGRLTSIDDISIHPASFRQEIIAASRPQYDEESAGSADEEQAAADVAGSPADEETPLLKSSPNTPSPKVLTNGHSHGGRDSSSRRRRRRDSSLHQQHNHTKPRKQASGGHGHDHGDMGMNAMVLHVLGDALGNVGVIITALIIWLTDWPGKFYADPAVSLFITLIILRSAIPLTLATSKILLQATPDHIDVNEVREDIQTLPGVISCHHVHIWQLSDTKIVASMHVQVAFPISEAGGEKYMELAMRARRCLHAYGIHSATIQPEFCLDAAHDHGEDAAMRLDGSNGTGGEGGGGNGGSAAAAASAATVTAAAAAASAAGGRSAAPASGAAGPSPKIKCGTARAGGTDALCLLECIDDCVGQGCCSGTSSRPATSHSSHSGASEGHSHRH